MATKHNRYSQWGLTHDPFSPLASSLDANVRRAVFTGYERYLDDILACLTSARACCVFGTYGIGKTFLMLESAARLREADDAIVPVYHRVLPRQGFDLAIVDGLFDTLKGSPGLSVESVRSDLEAARRGDVDPLHVARRLIEDVAALGKSVAFLIDDTDRVEELARIKAMIDTSREINALHCAIAVPSNPDNVTKILRTVGHGIFDTVNVEAFGEADFKMMVGRYLDTARTSVCDTEEQVGPTVFLCHAGEDRAEVRRLYGDLTAMGYRPWMAPDDILPGEEWSRSLDSAIKHASFFIACLSQNSVSKRGVVQRELKEALKRVRDLVPGDIFLIPCRFDDCQIPEDLRKYQAADVRTDGGLDRLAKALKRGIESRAIEEPTVRSKCNLKPFQEEAVSYLVGRIGPRTITPRLVVSSCRILLNLAVAQDADIITQSFVEDNWEHIGGNILANEGNLSRLVTLLAELAEQNGRVDEEVDLQTLKRMLGGQVGEFADVVKRIQRDEGLQDIFVVREEEGMTTVELSPFISPEFIKESFLKLKLDEFRREYGGGDFLVQRL